MAEEIAQQRLISLDVFRGMTIAGMVLVNNPGTWSAVYGPLKHAEWHGITPTDYVFPFFLFIVGVAIPMALGKRLEAGITRDVYWKILQRSVTIFALGLAMSVIPFFDFGKTDIPQLAKLLIMLALSAALLFLLLRKFREALILAAGSVALLAYFYFAAYTLVPYSFETMRIPGVLQRIAICYLIVSIIFLHTNWKQQAMIGGGLLLLYWFLMTAVPVPGCDVTTIDDKACNLAAWLDRTILGEAHLWRSAKVFDPEGILSTIPAIVTTISGVLTGTWLLSGGAEARTSVRAKSDDDTHGAEARTSVRVNSDDYTQSHGAPTGRSKSDIVAGLFFFGIVLVALGWAWNFYFPFNKSLWTSSYVIYTSGLALCFLGFCYWLIDITGYKRWSKPFVIFGVNALALFVFSGLMARFLGMAKITASDGQQISLQKWIFDTFFLFIASPINASLMYATCFILSWLFLMWLLYRKKVYIKV